ncbi:MAG TPA: hypothetical protein DCG69_10945 [Bacteroidales bacterium]|nr:hypothetical protein [Bacteroidales bacterium]
MIVRNNYFTFEMEKYTKIFYWMPRIICILAILFVSLFAADSFSPELTIWQQLSAFAIHLTPSFILIVFLVIAWKWDFIGGIIFILLGLGFGPIIFLHNYKMNQSIGMSLGIISFITFPFILVGILFVLNHFFRKRFPKTGYHHTHS